jgi:hypothetical protein
MKQTHEKSAAATPDKQGEPVNLLKRIGSATYVVNVHFSDKSKEKLEDKIIRLIEREVTADVS